MNVLIGMDDKDKILIHIDSGLTHFGTAKVIQEKYDYDLFAVANVDDNAKKFLKNQKLVNFKKIWFYPDHILNKTETPDVEYLKTFENLYSINIWKISFGERRFQREFNKFYKFSKNEILLIMEQAIKFFHSILQEAKPDFLIMKDPFAHDDKLLYEICKRKDIKILCMYVSRLGYRYVISNTPDKMDSINIIDSNSHYNTFEDLQKYFSKFDSFKVAKEMINISKIPIYSRVKAAIHFIFSKDNEFRNHYVNYGKTKWKILTQGSGRSFYRKRKEMESFLNNYSPKKIPENTPFVCFLLHSEPERALHVDSAYYSDQLEMIRKIAKSLPVEYKLFVKDHPAMKLVGWRTKDFYNQIMDMPNVRLLHYSIKPEKIYEKCSLIITINGTASLEANIFGCPSIVFSQIDFSEISSIFKVTNIEELPTIIKQALQTSVNPVEVGKYLTILEQNSFEFDLEGMTRDFLNRFHYAGFLKIPTYPQKKILKFFNDYRDSFDTLANENIKKIKQYKENLKDQKTKIH